MIEHEWRYLAKIVDVIDGDTIQLEIDLGFTIKWQARLRLLSSVGGVDTPELTSKDIILRTRAAEAKARTKELCPIGSTVRIRTEKDKRDSFGRYLAEVIFEHDGELYNLGDTLLTEGLAVIWTK